MRSCLVVFLISAAVAQTPATFRPKPVGNLKQVMRGIPFPNSNIIFDVQTKAPKTPDEWAAVEYAAMAIAETSNLINMLGRLRENGQPVPMQRADWIKFSQGLVEAGNGCYTAARSKSQEAVVGCTDKLSEACSNCHDVYRDNPQPPAAAVKQDKAKPGKKK